MLQAVAVRKASMSRGLGLLIVSIVIYIAIKELTADDSIDYWALASPTPMNCLSKGSLQSRISSMEP